MAPTAISEGVAAGFTLAADWFGLYWQYLLLLTFFVALALIFTPWARARLGGLKSPEYGRFKWIAMIMTTLLAGGGVFWAAAEPLYHYASVPRTSPTSSRALSRAYSPLWPRASSTGASSPGPSSAPSEPSS